MIVFSNAMISAGIKELMNPGNSDAETVIEIYRAMAKECCDDPQALIEQLAEARSKIFGLDALVEKYEERLEVTYEWGGDGEGNWKKIEIPKENRADAYDGIFCRDETISILRDAAMRQSSYCADLLSLLARKTLGPKIIELMEENEKLKDEVSMLKADLAEIVDEAIGKEIGQ